MIYYDFSLSENVNCCPSRKNYGCQHSIIIGIKCESDFDSWEKEKD